MQKYTILIFWALLLTGCAKVETASNENTQANIDKTISPSPTVETDKLLKSVTPKIKLNAKQTKYLNESLPSQVREVLEKAEKFELTAEVSEENSPNSDNRPFEPTRTVKVSEEIIKKEALEAFYYDASNEDSPAICFEPHHGIRAEYQGKTVEIEICFSCSRFVVKSSFGKYQGTIVRENRKSEDFFNRIIQNRSVEIK